MSKGHVSVSWGPSGGFYFIRERSATRLCLWRIAFTYLPGLEVDDLMRCLVSHDSYRERALAAEALVRAKDEAIGELLELRDRPIANGHREGIDFCSCWDIGRSCNCYCGYHARQRGDD